MKKIKLLLAAVAAMVGMGVQAQSWTASEVGAGQFYLYNVGAGMYLTAGGSWGTHSFVDNSGIVVTLAVSGEGYTINTKPAYNQWLNLNNSSEPFIDAPNSAVWTFVAVAGQQNTYLMKLGDNYLAYDGSNPSLVFPTDAPTTSNGYWKLVTKANRIADLANATEESPIDASFLLKDPNFGRNHQQYSSWTWTFPGLENRNNAGDNTNFCVESFHVAFDCAQIVEDAPNGYYAVRGQAFYRQDGSNNTDLPYFYIGNEKVTFPAKTGGENSMTDASTSFTAGNYMTSWSSMATYAGGSLKVGSHLDNNTDLWCIWDNIQIQYYGPIDLTAYATELANAVAAAEAVEGTVPAAVYANIANVITENNKTYTTEAEYTDAITAIDNAVSTYATAAIVADYARYNSVKAAALAISSSVDVTAADAAVDAATTTADIDAAVVALRTAFLAELPNVTVPETGLDVTAVMVDNASVSQNINYWTAEGTPNTSYSWAVCNYGECEFFQQNFKFYQTLALSTGTWEFGVTGFHRAGNHKTYFYAGGSKVLIPGVESSVVDNMAQAKTYFDNGNGKVNVKFALDAAGNVEIGIDNQDTETDKWTIFRDFTLKYYGEAVDLTPYKNALAEAVSAANAMQSSLPTAAYSALQTVVTNNNQEYTSVAEYETATSNIETATNNAKAIADAYTAYKSLSTAIQALYNVANYEELIAGARSTLGTAISDAATEVETKTTVNDINTVAETLRAAGATYAGAANPTNGAKFNLTFMLTNPNLEGLPTWTGAAGWHTDQTDGNSQVMTNGNATSADGTKTAFYEYWSSPAAANNLFALYQKVTLAEGTYNMTCYAFAQNDGTHVNHPNGVYFYANDVQGSAVNNARLSLQSIEFVNGSKQEVKIGLKTVTGNANLWMGIGYVELYKVQAKVVTIDEAVDYVAESAAAKVILNRTIKADIWNTIVLPFQLNEAELKAAFGDDVQIAEFSDAGDSENAVEVAFNTMATPAIAPNKPVLLKTSTAGTTYTFEGRTIAEGDAKVAGTYVDFVGTYAASTTIAEGNYFISANNLYKSNGGTTVKGTRAYIDAKNVASGEVKLFIGGIETGIDEINGTAVENGAIYNLAGQRVNKAQKGVFIVNGKKVIVK